MPLNREQLRAQLKDRELHPVYALFGAETYLRDIAAKTIADIAFGEDDFRDFNDNEFSLNDPDNVKSALAAADQLPMMASRRVVKITDVRVSSSAAKDTLKEEHFDSLSAYLANPSSTSIVIFIADELNGTRRMGKLLRDKTVSVDFTTLEDGELIHWVRGKLRELDSEIDDRTLKHLISFTGADARRLTTELTKLATAALPGKVIDIDLVDSLVTNVREISNFDLTAYLVAGDRPRALQTLEKILDDGTDPIALVGLLSYNYRRLLMVKDMMLRGVDRSEVARVVKLRFSDQEPFLAAARRADLRSLKKAVTRLAETDAAIKTSIGGSGPKGARMQIEMLVCELATT
jgi:DNA polymerase III subunit delta